MTGEPLPAPGTSAGDDLGESVLVEDTTVEVDVDLVNRLDQLLASAPVGATDGRPLLLLDVDGVLNYFPDEGQPSERYTRLVLPKIGSICISVDLTAWLSELSASFEFVWATTWEHQAVRFLAPHLGLPPMRVVEFDFDNLAPTRKLPSVRAFVGDRPCAWIDDVLFEDAAEWATSRAVPTMLIRTDPRTGLGRPDVDGLLAFAADCRSLRTSGAAAVEPTVLPLAVESRPAGDHTSR